MLTCGKDNPSILLDLKRRLRLRFEQVKSLSTFNWKSNQDLFVTFRNHHEDSKEICTNRDYIGLMHIEDKLYLAMIKFLNAVADIMCS